MRRPGGLIAVGVGLVLVAACISTDAPVPPRYVEAVSAARAKLETSWDNPGLPSFAFDAVRCRADGGLLVVFEQGGIPGGYAIAMREPVGDGDGWSGGYGIDDVSTEPEVGRFFTESPEVACPA